MNFIGVIAFITFTIVSVIIAFVIWIITWAIPNEIANDRILAEWKKTCIEEGYTPIPTDTWVVKGIRYYGKWVCADIKVMRGH